MLARGANEEVLHAFSQQRGHGGHLLISGELDLATLPVLEQWLQGAESNGNSAIVVDLENVTFMDVSSLRAFLRAADRASRSGRSFSIVKAQALVRKVLRITRTTHLLGSDTTTSSERQRVGVSH